MVPKIYTGWYNRLSALYDKYKRAVAQQGQWNATEKVIGHGISSRRNIQIMASALCMWTAVSCDLFGSFTEGCNYVSGVLIQYLDNLEQLFTDIKETVTLIRNCADWGDLPITTSRLRLYYPLFRFPMWRTDSSSFRAVHCLLNFMQRICIDRDVLEEKAYTAYRKAQEDVLVSYSDEAWVYIGYMTDYITTWTDGWDPATIANGVKFSSGSTADVGRDLAKKVKCLSYVPPKIRKLLRTDCPALFKLLRCDYDAEEGLDGPALPEGKHGATPLIFSEFQSVPKTALGKRTICMERAVLNFFQNGLDYSIRKCRSFPRGSIRFEDQGFSRVKALEASRTGLCATVDFSAASDSVSWRLVQELFSRRPKLVEWLDATRSEVAWYQKLKVAIYLTVYAAMGSVTCFTIESLVFLAMAKTACVLSGVPTHQCVVYGDDVILPAAAYAVLQKIAASLGFKLNLSKSFATGPFREACGVFAFRGCDVTTPSYPRQWVNFFFLKEKRKTQNLDFTKLVAINQVGNEFYDAGLTFTRYVCVRALIDSGISFLSGNPDQWSTTFSYPLRMKGVVGSEYRFLPCAPLFVFSDRSTLSSYRNNTWLEQPSDLRVVKKTKIKYLLQSEDDLPLPERVTLERARTVEQGVGFVLSSGKPGIDTMWDGEERLATWLYLAEFTERSNLIPVDQFSPIYEPRQVAPGVSTSEQAVKTTRVILNYSSR